MARPDRLNEAHTGSTPGGNTRDVKVERIGKVTIYRRGKTYYLYYRENKKTERRPIEGNLAVARATAAKTSAALTENRPAPLGFQRSSPDQMVKGFLGYVEDVKALAWRTCDRYRAALDRFLEYCKVSSINAVDAMDETKIEDFVKWLRRQTRTRNGMDTGKRGAYKVGGIRFIMATCRTAYNWAGRHRMLPPYAENPFTKFPIDELRDPDAEDSVQRVFTVAQETAFWANCSEWQRDVFLTLATYGMRVGELTNLLIENVDLTAGTIEICSKPEMYWKTKTARRRKLPLTTEIATIFKKLIGSRKAGFVFLNEPFVSGTREMAATFATDKAFREHLSSLVAKLEAENPVASKRDKRRAVVTFCRAMGQIPVKRLQAEFSAITAKIGCPEFTRVHDLRHLFTTRAQERGANPLLVQQIVGHSSLSMTRRYTHLGMDAMRQTFEQAALPQVKGGDRAGT
jgi:integrase